MPEFVREEYLENYIKDDLLAGTIASSIGIKNVDINGFVLEGGAVEQDGRGTIITTESCILNENRNPGATRAEAENYLKKYLEPQTSYGWKAVPTKISQTDISMAFCALPMPAPLSQ